MPYIIFFFFIETLFLVSSEFIDLGKETRALDAFVSSDIINNCWTLCETMSSKLISKTITIILSLVVTKCSSLLAMYQTKFRNHQ